MNENNNDPFLFSCYDKNFKNRKPIHENNNKLLKTQDYKIDIHHKKISPKKLISSRNKNNNNKLSLGTDIGIRNISPDNINKYIISENIKTIIKSQQNQNQPQNIWIINNFLNSKDSRHNSPDKEVKMANTSNNFYKKNPNKIYNDNKNKTIYRRNNKFIVQGEEKRYLKTDQNVNQKGKSKNNNIINKIYNRNNSKNDNKSIEINNNNEKDNKRILKTSLKEEDELINKINTDILIKNCQKFMENKEKKINNNKYGKTSETINNGNNNLMKIGKIKVPKGIKNNNIIKNSLSVLDLKNEQNKKKEKIEDLFNKYNKSKAITKLKGDYTFESLLGANLDTIQNLNYENYDNSLIDDLIINDKNNNNINYNNNFTNFNSNINNEDNNSTYIDILTALKENTLAKINKKSIINNDIDKFQNNNINKKEKNQITKSENIDTNNEEGNDNNINGRIKKIKLKLGRISNQNKYINNNINNINKGITGNYYTNDNINNNNNNERIKWNNYETNINFRNRINNSNNNNNNMLYQKNIGIKPQWRSGGNTPYRKKTPINKRTNNTNYNNQFKIIKNNIKIINHNNPINNKGNNCLVYSKKTNEIKSSISCKTIVKNKINK